MTSFSATIGVTQSSVPLLVVLILTSLPLVCAVATTLAFDGSQHVFVTLPVETRTEVEDTSVRFRTNQSHALLFVTSAKTSDDRLSATLDAGRVRIDLRINSLELVSTCMTSDVQTPLSPALLVP